MIKIELFHAAFEKVPRLVATLECTCSLEDALERVYVATLGGEDDCWLFERGQDQEGIDLIPSDEVWGVGQCRSTWIGDFARVIEESLRESYWRCCAVGWREITSVNARRMVGMEAQLHGYPKRRVPGSGQSDL